MWRSRTTKRGLSLFFVALVAFTVAAPVQAQEWPAKVVKFVSPYPPGGSVDPLARILAAKLTESLNPNLPFDPVKDFAPVMIVGTAPMAITTGMMKPYKNFADVLAAAKA